MTKIVQPEEGERHPYRVHIAKTLDRLIIDLDVKASWLAHCLGISEALLSDYRSGRLALPAYRAALVDDLLGSRSLLESLAAFEGCHLVSKDSTSLTPEDLEKLFPLILRAEGAANADIVDALMDHMLDGAEKASIHAHAQKLRRFWQDIEERTAR